MKTVAIGCTLALAGFALPTAVLAQPVHQHGQNNIVAPHAHASGSAQLTRAQVMQDYEAFKQAGGLDYVNLGYTKPNQAMPAALQQGAVQGAAPAHSGATLDRLYGN
ncbi:DUF4148 domain-containing protein [Comamonas serinivorans]|nr:DUF4148 domain-containing protein [Comamonas serinivorans]